MHYALGIFLGVSFNVSYKDFVVVNKLDCSEFFEFPYALRARHLSKGFFQHFL